MANHRYQILDKNTGELFQHSGLIQRKFFTTVKAVRDFVQENPGVTFSVYDSLGQELPHFFDDVAWYTIRHLMGKLWVPEGATSAMWSRRTGHIATQFDRDNRGHAKKKEDRIPELKDPKQWRMVDQFLREKTTCLDRFYVVPEDAGKWGLLYNYGGHKGLVMNRSGRG